MRNMASWIALTSAIAIAGPLATGCVAQIGEGAGSDPEGNGPGTVGFASTDRRLNTGSACIGCHADGMNRGDNDLRDWLDGGRRNLPSGEHGVDG